MSKVGTRERILRAALSTFAEKGYHRALVDDIVRVSGTSKGAVYHHFPNKERLFLALVEDLAARLATAVAAAVAGSHGSLPKVEAALRAGLEALPAVTSGDARGDHAGRAPHEHERRRVPHDLHDRDPARQRSQESGRRPPGDLPPRVPHRIAPRWCQAVRSARIRRTPAVTACTLMVAPEMLRMSLPTAIGSAAVFPRNCLRHDS